jgi:diguanylate cyclase (GGDEF)-like protein
MSVISIKNLPTAEGQGAGHPLRVAQILMRGIGLHAIEGDPEASRQFRAEMEHAAEKLGPATVTDAAALVAAAAALKLLDEYNRDTEGYLQSCGNDLRSMVKMLTEAITEFSAASGENVQRLKHIESRVASAGQANDVPTMKKQLSQCLEEIKQEVERQKSATEIMVSRLQVDLERARTESVDPATGFPPRSKAVEAIRQACSSDEPAFAVVMAIDRLQSINLSFGSEVGDQALRCFTNHLRRNLRESDSVFRWTGASLLAIVKRGDNLQQVRDEFARVMSQKVEYSFETAKRSVLLPVTARWNVFPSTGTPAELMSRIDAFASPGTPA